MKYRKISKLGIEVSSFGLGCMRFPMTTDASGAEIVDETISTPIIRHAIECGVNYFDTAYTYSNGRNEEALGHALRDGYRDKVYVATKLPAWVCNDPSDMERVLNEQLTRLETDHIDFYLVHSLTKKNWQKMCEFGILEFLDRAKSVGKIRYACFSFHDDYDTFIEIIDSYDWDMCQLQFNFMDIDNQATIRGVEYAGKKGIPVVVMEGLLGGKLAKAPDNVQALYDAFPQKRSPVEWAFRWVCNHAEVATVLSGVTNMEQLEDNLEIFERCGVGEMSTAEKDLINNVRDAYNSRTKVGCTGCRYCMPCPMEVNIAGIFARWNTLAMYNTPMKADHEYKRMIEKGMDASKCISCHACESSCPQKIDISEKLKSADTDMK